MSAVHGPMPWIAVSAACASSAASSPSAASGKLAARDRAGDCLERADFRRRQPEPREPRGARARMIAAGSNGSNAAASRPQIAPALAVESCCDTMVAASPAKPSGRRRSGGRPAVAMSAAKRGSALPSAASAVSRSASVWM